jgi:hypothetical protein
MYMTKVQFSTRNTMEYFLWCDGPDAQSIVGETSEQCLSVSRPGNGDTFRLSSFLAHISVSRLEFIHDGSRRTISTSQIWIKKVNSLALKVENFYTASSGGAQPISVWWENKGIDNVTGLQRVQVFALVQVPKHSDAIFASWSSKRAIRRDGDCVDVTSVAVVVGFQFELGEFPNLIKKVRLVIRSKRKNDRR